MIDETSKTYTCPFCNHVQAFAQSYECVSNGPYSHTTPIPAEYKESSYRILTIRCSNTKCKRISVVAINRTSGKQVDIVPQNAIKVFPEYIPEQIRQDYEEASQLLYISPRACATLLRRCLQGMIHDFWGIHEKNLNAEITTLKNMVTGTQWAALDGLRKIGNIGAHMENDVNLVIDIDPGEAEKLKMLIELLFDKWYISRYEENQLLSEIVNISDQKDKKRRKISE